MARVWVLSHGARPGGLAETFVPTGKTVHYYAEFDENTLRITGLAALNAGDIKPTQSFGGGATISNYYLSAFEDSAIAEHLVSLSSRSGGELAILGGDLPAEMMLCTAPNQCTRTRPNHAWSCAGLFRRIQQDEIHLVACRGVLRVKDTDPKSNATVALGKDTSEALQEYYKQNEEFAAQLLEMARTDPQGAIAYFNSLGQTVQAQLRGTASGLQFVGWVEQTLAGIELRGRAAVWLDPQSQTSLLGNARPKSFEKCWADQYWRNVFWQWFRGPAHATGQQEALLYVYDLLLAYYDDKSVDNAREIVDYCEGGKGVVPVVDHGIVAELKARVEDGDPGRKEVDRLYDSVVAQLDAVYPTFYEDVGSVKEALR